MPAMQRLKRYFPLAPALALLACACDKGAPSVPADARAPDAAVGSDAATAADASGAVDAGVPADAEGPGVFGLVVVPDTQREMWDDADTRFADRMSWIVASRDALDIRFVAQVGDLVDTDNCRVEYVGGEAACSAEDLANNVYHIIESMADRPHYQYEHASSGLALLDAAGIPYALALGNHDTSAVCGGPACSVPGMTTNQLLRSTRTWNATFPPGRLAAAAGFFEAGKTDNVYHAFSAGGLRWLVLSLELWPRSAAVDWARTVVADHPDHNVIVVTHSYLTSTGAVGGFEGYGDTRPEYLRDNLVLAYPNVRLTFSGHTGTTARREEVGVAGSTVYSFLDCYHDTAANPTRVVRLDTAGGSIDTWVHVPRTGADRTDGRWTISGVEWVR